MKSTLYAMTIALIIAISCCISSCSEEKEKEDAETVCQQQTDMMVETEQPVEDCDTVEPVHLYEEVKKGNFLDLILLNSGNGLIRQLGYVFAGEYCKKCEVTVLNTCWESEELCSEWLDLRLEEGWYDTFKVGSINS